MYIHAHDLGTYPLAVINFLPHGCWLLLLWCLFSSLTHTHTHSYTMLFSLSPPPLPLPASLFTVVCCLTCGRRFVWSCLLSFAPTWSDDAPFCVFSTFNVLVLCLVVVDLASLYWCVGADRRTFSILFLIRRNYVLFVYISLLKLFVVCCAVAVFVSSARIGLFLMYYSKAVMCEYVSVGLWRPFGPEALSVFQLSLSFPSVSIVILVSFLFLPRTIQV